MSKTNIIKRQIIYVFLYSQVETERKIKKVIFATHSTQSTLIFLFYFFFSISIIPSLFFSIYCQSLNFSFHRDWELQTVEKSPIFPSLQLISKLISHKKKIHFSSSTLFTPFLIKSTGGPKAQTLITCSSYKALQNARTPADRKIAAQLMESTLWVSLFLLFHGGSDSVWSL